jgi:hypothetical protein
MAALAEMPVLVEPYYMLVLETEIVLSVYIAVVHIVT